MSEEPSRARRWARQRRKNAPGGRRYAHNVRVTEEEEAILARLASEQHVTIPRLLIEATMSVESRETPTQRKEVIAELFRIYRLLAAISNNVNQMAKAANATGEVACELDATLDAVRSVARRIDLTIDELGQL